MAGGLIIWGDERIRPQAGKEAAKTYVTAARFDKDRLATDGALREKANRVQHYLEEIALDVGLDPNKNVTRVEVDDEVRIGISEEMDEFYREAPGSWRFY
ncbi:hypothetical protein [Pseudodesulfovibrio methanolicus]|uniref:Uncharacterized protein n=1 Tax=Pseudodesulfovibrio methanolicus TaxID=3126690 RepID=A0ABZ2IXD1_9BACT